MVAFADIGKVQELYTEASSIDGVLGNFDAGGEIVQMTVSGWATGQIPPPFTQRTAVSVNTVGISYPPAMLEAIKAALTKRRGEIEAELAGLGVSGVEGAAPAAAEPARSPRR